MEWMIHLSSLILFTAVTGSILLLIWYAIGWRLEGAGGLKYLYTLLKGVTVFFLIPVVYGLLYGVNERKRIGAGELFWPTPTIYQVCAVFLIVWLAGMIAFSVYFIWRGRNVRHYYRNRFSCSCERQMIFEELCKEMGIRPGKVRLCECYEVGLPFLSGWFRPILYLPVETSEKDKMTEYELKVVLVHELTHYKNRDVLWQRIGMLIQCCQWFNPFVFWLRWTIREWSEYACDFSASEKVGGTIPYFAAITNIAERASNWGRGSETALVRKKHELERRVLHMKKYKKQIQKTLIKVLTLVSVMLAAVSICVTSSALANGYIALFNKTAVYIEETVVPRETIEYVEYTEEVDAAEEAEIGEVRTPKSMESVGWIEWLIDGGAIMKSEEFYVESGSCIRMNAWVSPSNVDIRMGLQTPYGTYRYIVGNDDISHDFQITQSGNYRVYIKNQGTVEASVTGMYSVVTE